MKATNLKYKLALLFLACLAFFPSEAQISLDDCIKSALESHPALKNRNTFESINQIELKNNRTSKYPSFTISGQGKYQSEVVEFDIEAPFGELNFPEIPHFQYNLSVNANQVLYDGGKRRLEKNLLELENKERKALINAKEREVEEQVQNLYLEVLMVEKQMEIIKLHQKTLESAISRLEAGYAGGVVSEIDLKILKAERIVIKRKLISLEEIKNSIIDNLSTLCNIEIDVNESFQIPSIDFSTLTPSRSEYEIFDYRQEKLEVSKKMAGLKLSPHLNAFAQAGYGRPGLNFISDTWNDFYVAGFQFSWIPWDYREVKRTRSVIDLNSQLIQNERKLFDLQLDTAIDRILNRIIMIEKIIIEDENMLIAREAIRKAMEKKLDEGVVTSSEFISELNKEEEARINLEKSRLELLANQLAYRVINGY